MVRIATLAKNESERFLPQLLPIWAQLGEVWCLIDGTSDDVEATQALCDEHGARHEVFDAGWAGGEQPMRRAQWEWVTPGAEWVVHMDADHCPAGDFRPHLAGNRVSLWVFDMWGPGVYRHDGWKWMARPWWHAVRVSDFQHHDWLWSTKHLHGGHLPLNEDDFGPVTPLPSSCGLLHYGYATPELRRLHHDWYMQHESVLSPQELAQARSIVFPDPPRHRLGFEPTWTLTL